MERGCGAATGSDVQGCYSRIAKEPTAAEQVAGMALPGDACSPAKGSELVQEIAVMLQKMHKQSELTLQALRNLYGVSDMTTEDNLNAMNKIRKQEERLAMRQQAAQQMLRGQQVQSIVLRSLDGTDLGEVSGEVQPEQTPEKRSSLSPAVSAAKRSLKVIAGDQDVTHPGIAGPDIPSIREASVEEILSQRSALMPEWTPEKESLATGTDRPAVASLSDGSTAGEPVYRVPSKTIVLARPVVAAASLAEHRVLASSSSSTPQRHRPLRATMSPMGSSRVSSFTPPTVPALCGSSTSVRSASSSMRQLSSASRERSSSIREVALSPARWMFAASQDESVTSISIPGARLHSALPARAPTPTPSPGPHRTRSPGLLGSAKALALADRAAAETAAGAVAAVAAIATSSPAYAFLPATRSAASSPRRGLSASRSRLLSPAPISFQQPSTAQPLQSLAADPPMGLASLTSGGSQFEFEAGAHTVAGLKKLCKDWVNQDMHLVLPIGTDKMFVAVFDGHGVNGHHSASLARNMFAEQAPALAYAGSRLEAMFQSLFQNVQASLEAQGLARMSGTTATAALVDASTGTLSTAHVGDSRLLATLGSRVYFETVDHVFDAAAESRCQERGGEVRWETVAGVSARRIFKRGEAGPGLTMSRSLGDAECHALGVVSEPTIHCGVPFYPGCTLVVATDGVWEKLSSERGATDVASCGTEAAAMALVDEAHKEWPQEGDIDDITAVVLRLVGVSPALGLNSLGPNLVAAAAEASKAFGSPKLGFSPKLGAVRAASGSSPAVVPAPLPVVARRGLRRGSPERAQVLSPGRYSGSPMTLSGSAPNLLHSCTKLPFTSQEVSKTPSRSHVSPLRNTCSPLRR